MTSVDLQEVSLKVLLGKLKDLRSSSAVRTGVSFNKLNLATVVEGDQKDPFSIATTPRCEGGR